MTKFDINNPFADIEDDLDAAPVREPRQQNPHVENIGGVEVPGFVENCPKCRGTGNFVGYTGRVVGQCYKCKGTGKLTFKTAPAARAKARASAQKRKQRNEAENVIAFNEAHPVEAEWLSKSSSDFATSLVQGIAKYGSLTENQLAAVRKCIAREQDAAEGYQAWAAENEDLAAWLNTESEAGNEFAASLQAAVKRYGSLTPNQEAAVRRNLEIADLQAKFESDLDVSSLKGYYAVPDGDTRLKLCVRHPGKNSRYHGWVFVDDGAHYGARQTYGKQAPGGTYKGKVQDALRAILADPLEAQKAYGHLTGTCGRCGRPLEDEQSVAMGIGPICATKY